MSLLSQLAFRLKDYADVLEALSKLQIHLLKELRRWKKKGCDRDCHIRVCLRDSHIRVCLNGLLRASKKYATQVEILMLKDRGFIAGSDDTEVELRHQALYEEDHRELDSIYETYNTWLENVIQWRPCCANWKDIFPCPFIATQISQPLKNWRHHVMYREDLQ